MFRLFNDLMV